ncbi:MAG: hypothetical protein AAFW70_07050 [Cyanobacteria bacterium J06635_10]
MKEKFTGTLDISQSFDVPLNGDRRLRLKNQENRNQAAKKASLQFLINIYVEFKKYEP